MNSLIIEVLKIILKTASFLRQSTDIHMRNHMDFVNQCNINNMM